METVDVLGSLQEEKSGGMTERRGDGQGGGQRQWRGKKIKAKPLLTR